MKIKRLILGSLETNCYILENDNEILIIDPADDYEEIIKNNILPIEVLSSMRIEFLKQIKPKMTYSKHFKKNEILLFDIYEIHLPDEYTDMIRKYVKEENDLIKLVDREDIEKECVDIRGKSFKIGAHSQYII